jgi:hypothetical protein
MLKALMALGIHFLAASLLTLGLLSLCLPV